MGQTSTLPDDDLDGNKQDGRDLAEKHEEELVKGNDHGEHDDIEGYDRDNDGLNDREGETADAERSALSDQEAEGGSYYKESESPYQGNDLKSRALRMRGVQNKGATTGVAASILFVGGIMLSMATGSSFWTAFEKNLTNDASDDARVNSVLHRAFNNLFSVCKPGTLSCKLKTMTKEQVKKWKEGAVKIKGTIVDDKGNPTRGSPNDVIDPDKMQPGERVAAKSATFSDGYEAKTVNDVNTHIETNIDMRSRLSRAFSPLTADFIHGKFGKMLSEKFGINKSRVSPEEKKTNNAKENAKPAAEKAVEKATGSLKERALKAATSSTAQVAQLGIDYACMAYNTTRIAVGAVKAKWTIDLVRFAWPFIRLASKIQDGSATDQDFQQIEDKFTQLVDYLSPTRAAELKDHIRAGPLNDVDKRELEEFGINSSDDQATQIQHIDEITNKNAFDSQGLQQVIYGNTDGITAFTKQFGLGIIGAGTLTADFIVKKIQGYASFGGADDLISGKQNIKSFCKANKALGAILAAGGLAEVGFDIANCVAAAGTAGADVPSLLDCGKRVAIIAIKMTAWIGAFALVGELISTAVVAAVVAQAPELPSDALRGPAAGDAIASGVALLLAHKAMSSGLKPAMSVAAVNSFISSTQTQYDAYGDQVAYYNARQTPFDTTNRYSFMGQIMASIKPPAVAPGQQQSAFSYISNMVNIVSGTLGNTANALHSEPSLMTAQQNDLIARTNNGKCEIDEEKAELGMMCDASTGRTIQVSSPRVLQWADEDATGATDHLTDAINWMQQPQGANEAEDGGGTQDEGCTGVLSKIYSVLSLDWGDIGACSDSGEKASIDADGKPVPGSQYEKFVNYCRTQRELEYGSTDIDQSTGSAKEQAWHDGSQCALSYDSNGNASTGDNFDKSKDTGKGSLMMDYFTYYYNMCNVQYATQNNATDCTNDTPPDAGSSASPTSANCGDGTRSSIYECALQFDQYGYGLTMDHGEYGKKSWYDSFKSSNPAPDALKLDCSALVMASLVAAFGQDVPNMIAPASFSGDGKNWQSVPKDQAQRGDVIVQPGHVEIIKDNDTAKQYFTTFGAHTASVELDKQIGPTGYSYGDVGVGTFRYVGPGIGKDTGNVNV